MRAPFDLFAADHRERIRENLVAMVAALSQLGIVDQIEMLNAIRATLHEVGPFKGEPVDYVQWIAADHITANDYNPNTVAPPEMELLKLSIEADGYTQPIVANVEDGVYVVVDGFHRNRVGREVKSIAKALHGHLPIVQIRGEQTERPDRIASTIRHNRARGKHRVEAMSDIVLELKRRNWSDEKIGRQLGMDPDEVLRLAQITGLAEMFKDREFSEAWLPGTISETDNLLADEEIDDAP